MLSQSNWKSENVIYNVLQPLSCPFLIFVQAEVSSVNEEKIVSSEHKQPWVSYQSVFHEYLQVTHACLPCLFCALNEVKVESMSQ